MHPDISELVSQSFYGGKLRAHPSARREHGVRQPEILRRATLLWVDTSSLGLDAFERGRVNEAEMQLLRHLLQKMGALPEHQRGIPSAVVLSPYLKQLEFLRKRISQLPQEAFHSVDSFQGRQAEVVFVSLVRNNANEQPLRALGFLREPERVNVMFSRARRLLIILGSLAHFERFKGLHWDRVTQYIRSQRRFLVDASAPELGFRLRTSGGLRP